MVLPKVGYGPQTMRTSVVRVSVARVSSHDARLPVSPNNTNPLYVCMRSKNAAGKSHDFWNCCRSV